MIKVLQVFARTGRGGAETLVMTHYRHIDRSKFHFDFVNHTEQRCEYDEEIEKLGGKIFHLPSASPLRTYELIRAWDSFLSVHNDYDVIHVHYFTIAGIILPIAQKYGIKVRIVHAHATHIRFFKNLIFSALRKRMIKSSTLLIACGRDAGRAIFKTDDFIVFNNAIESTRYYFNEDVRVAKRLELGISKDSFVMGHVGSLTPVKNHNFIIKIFAEVHKIISDSKLLLVGDGPLKKELLKIVDNYGLGDAVIFTGSRSDVPDLLMAMDMFIFPSFHEGLPISVVEAQNTGLYCVISDIITDEVVISDLVKKIKLGAEEKIWVDCIVSNSKRRINRLSYKHISADNKYDVFENVKILETIYSR